MRLVLDAQRLGPRDPASTPPSIHSLHGHPLHLSGPIRRRRLAAPSGRTDNRFVMGLNSPLLRPRPHQAALRRAAPGGRARLRAGRLPRRRACTAPRRAAAGKGSSGASACPRAGVQRLLQLLRGHVGRRRPGLPEGGGRRSPADLDHGRNGQGRRKRDGAPNAGRVRLSRPVRRACGRRGVRARPRARRSRRSRAGRPRSCGRSRRFGLDENAGAAEIKAQYKVLVKRFHPDAHGGDRSYEDAAARHHPGPRHAEGGRPLLNRRSRGLAATRNCTAPGASLRRLTQPVPARSAPTAAGLLLRPPPKRLLDARDQRSPRPACRT